MQGGPGSGWSRTGAYLDYSGLRSLVRLMIELSYTEVSKYDSKEVEGETLLFTGTDIRHLARQTYGAGTRVWDHSLRPTEQRW